MFESGCSAVLILLQEENSSMSIPPVGVGGGVKINGDRDSIPRDSSRVSGDFENILLSSSSLVAIGGRIHEILGFYAVETKYNINNFGCQICFKIYFELSLLFQNMAIICLANYLHGHSSL